MLFVHGGVDPAAPIPARHFGEAPDFFRLTQPYADFKMVYSTLVPEGQDQVLGPGRLAADGGAGRGGLLHIFK